jgi:predicted Zn finger-like uncharacterized protein
MIITCANCNTQFELAAEILAPDGRRVKCTECGELWFQLPDPEELANLAAIDFEEIPESLKKPSAPRETFAETFRDVYGDDEVQKKSRGLGKARLAGFAVAAIVLGLCCWILAQQRQQIVNLWPASAMLFKTAGLSVLSPGEGLVFDGIKVLGIPKKDGREAIEVSGRIINLTGQSIHVPMIEASALDSKGVQNAIWHIDIPEEKIEAEREQAFTARFDNAEAGAEKLKLRFVLAPGASSKTVSEDDENTPAPAPADHSDPHAPAAVSESHAPVSPAPHPESEPFHPEGPSAPGHLDTAAPADPAASAHH